MKKDRRIKMVNLYKQDGETLYGIKEFLLDSADDLSSLPTKIRSGSSALIIPTGELYILNGDKEWKILGGESSGGSTGVNPDAILSKYDADNNGIIDRAEESDTFIMYDM